MDQEWVELILAVSVVSQHGGDAMGGVDGVRMLEGVEVVEWGC